MSSNGSASPDSLQRLIDRPYEFDFVQAVQTIQRQTGSDRSAASSVGYDSEIRNESVRFRVATTLRSVAAQVMYVEANEESNCYEFTVPFIGLIGVNGVLPRHYTQTVIRRVKQRDYAMRDFFDLFHHRIISLFFRASTKYRLPYVYLANAIRTPDRDDEITDAMYCVLGIGHQPMKNKLAVHDYTRLIYGGHFADTKPTGHSLQRMVGDFLALSVEIQQFQFEWLYIDPAEQTKLIPGKPARLGQDIVIGEKVPSFQTRFRVRVGPVGWNDFMTLLPSSNRVDQLSDLVRTYVGIGMDYDLQVLVRSNEIPKLSFSSETPPMLGWTTWLNPEPSDVAVEDAIFDISNFKPRALQENSGREHHATTR